MNNIQINSLILILGTLIGTPTLASQSMEANKGSKIIKQEQQLDYQDLNNPLNSQTKTIHIQYHYIGEKFPADSEDRIIELWRTGYKYYKSLHSVATKNGELLVSEMLNEPDYWSLLPQLNQGLHFKEKENEKDKNGHIFYLQDNYANAMEFGNEAYYFQKHHAFPVPGANPNELVYELKNDAYTLTLHLNRNTNYPTQVIFHPLKANDPDGNFSVVFDEYQYETPDMTIYTPKNMDIKEGSAKEESELFNNDQ